MNLDNEYPHRRFNPLTGEYVLVSPHRTKRPWQGKRENTSIIQQPEYDSNCYLCPGNERAGGKVNSNYETTYVFTNDFSALLLDTQIISDNSDPLFQTESINGTSRVICFSPKHNLTLPRMDVIDIRKVINVWSDQVEELGKTYKWVQVFENKGDIMGCSNPHPHGQIWASNSLPNEPFKENQKQQEYFLKNNSVLLIDYLRNEKDMGARIITENKDWLVLVPFWAVWPFETMLLPKRHILRLNEVEDSERVTLAEILKSFLTRYDNLFDVSFPYTMGWHGAPFDNSDNNHWQLHAHFYPPLLRSATVKKFMVGYEMLSEAQRDITAEQAAEQLRNVSDQFE
jgi:UDPglucose--hexose-1-phosphate uridylyltransferase